MCSLGEADVTDRSAEESTCNNEKNVCFKSTFFKGLARGAFLLHLLKRLESSGTYLPGCGK